MTNKEAIDLIENYIEPCKGCHYKHDLGCEIDKDCCNALDEAVSALESQEKYKWHDLRKNPDDYPTDHRMYLLRLNTNEEIIKHVMWRGDMIRPNVDEDIHILAWREIEPFEVGNE